MLYQLIYEFKNPNKDYYLLYDYLEHKLGEQRIQVLSNVWWFYNKSELNIDVLCKKIRELLAKRDVFYISPLPAKTDDNIDGILPNSLWVWYKEKIN